MIYFVIGLCLGLVMKEVEELRKKIERDSRYHYDSVKALEDETTTQKNVVKALNEDNVRLRKRLGKKNETKTD